VKEDQRQAEIAVVLVMDLAEVVDMVEADLSLIHEKIALANPGFREAAPDGGHVRRD
jgi:hypothetical protein